MNRRRSNNVPATVNGHGDDGNRNIWQLQGRNLLGLVYFDVYNNINYNLRRH
jgi:hypothetical protein